MLHRTTLFLMKKRHALATVIQILYRTRRSIRRMDMLSSHVAMTASSRRSVNCLNAKTWRQTPDLLRIHNEFVTARNLCLLYRKSSCTARQRNGYQSCALQVYHAGRLILSARSFMIRIFRLEILFGSVNILPLEESSSQDRLYTFRRRQRGCTRHLLCWGKMTIRYRCATVYLPLLSSLIGIS